MEGSYCVNKNIYFCTHGSFECSLNSSNCEQHPEYGLVYELYDGYALHVHSWSSVCHIFSASSRSFHL